MLILGERFDNIAAGVQKLFEELTMAWVKAAVAKTGMRKAAFSGGIFLNVKGNKLLLESGLLDGAFFFPACGDNGTSIGAALQVYWELCERDGIKTSKSPLRDLYLG